MSLLDKVPDPPLQMNTFEPTHVTQAHDFAISAWYLVSHTTCSNCADPTFAHLYERIAAQSVPVLL